MTKNFFSGSHLVIVVYSVDSPSSFKSIDNHMHSIDQYCKEDVIKVIVGNKCDLESERRITYDDMMDRATELNNIKAFETSAIDGRKSTINELFQECTFMLCQTNMVKSQSFRIGNRPIVS